MLKLPLYQDLSTLWSSYEASDKELLIVCPSPAIADGTRKRTQNLNASVITMASFSQQLADQLDIDSKNFRRKSELLFHLSFYAKQAFGMKYQEFLTAFNVFTELRGISSDITVIETVLDEYLPRIKEWVMSFYGYIDATGWIDEHGLYHLISSQLDTKQADINKRLIFYGFSHLTGSQVDFLKKLSSNVDIILPYREKLFEKRWPTDWISWFETSSEVTNIVGQEFSNRVIDVYQYTDIELGQKLKSLFKFVKGRDIIYAKKSLEAKDIMEIPHNDLSFKINYEFFDLELDYIKDLLATFNNQVSFLIKRVQVIVSSLDFEVASDFKKFKVLSLLQSKLSLFPNDYIVGEFEVGVLLEVLRLDLPRLSLTSFFTENNEQRRLLSLESLDDPEISNDSIFVISSGFSPFRGSTELFSEEVEKHISSVSPMRRTSLEDEMLIEAITEKLSSHNIKILVESEVIEKEPKWIELFERIHSQNLDLIVTRPIENKIELKGDSASYQGEKSHYFSATRIQSHLDCHLNYYYKYVDSIFPNYSFETELEPRELGSLEHEIIAKYCEQYTEYDFKKLSAKSTKILETYLKQENKRLDEFRKSSFLELINQYAKVGIQSCYDIQKVMSLSSMPIFERKINDEFSELNRSGAIDFSYFSKQSLVLIDFKRGAGGIPSWSEIEEFQKIQFLFYLNIINSRIDVNEVNDYFMGYLCLSDLEKSMIWTSDSIKEDFLAMGYPSKIFKKNNIIEAFKEYPDWEKDYISKINEQKIFAPNPRKKEVCRYCDLKNICSRGVMS